MEKLYIENGKEFLATDHRGRKKGEPIKNIISICKNLKLNDLQTKTEKALYNENERLRAELAYSKKLNALIQSRQTLKKR